MDGYDWIPSNLVEQIEVVRDYDISYDTLHPKAILRDKQSNRTIRVPYSAFSSKYKDFLSTIIISTELNDELKRAFWYKPKTVSLYYYDTTEIWADLLVINGCVGLREFTPEVLKYYDPNELKKIINEIMILEGMYN